MSERLTEQEIEDGMKGLGPGFRVLAEGINRQADHSDRMWELLWGPALAELEGEQ